MGVIELVPKSIPERRGTEESALVSQSSLLAPSDLESLLQLAEELQETFEKTQVFRTRTEMEVSVLNEVKFPTPSSKYWQAVREQNVMFTELVMLSFEYRKNLIEAKLVQQAIKAEDDSLKRELLQIDLDKRRFLQKQMERVARARLRELEHWSEIKKREANQMSPEDLADVDNPQLIGYTKRWIRQAIVMGADGSPSERQNLLGQLRSGIHACNAKGVLNKVLEGFDLKIQKQIRAEYGI